MRHVSILTRFSQISNSFAISLLFCVHIADEMPLIPHYPATRRDETVKDVLHGHEIIDPYRALEDPDAEETAIFREQQNAVTQKYLSRASEFRANVKGQVEALHNYDKFSVVWKAGSYYYYSHHAGMANQAVIMQAVSLDSENAEVFLDPNKLADDGTASLGTMAWSEDGRFLAYGIQRSGSDWADIHVMDAHSKEVLDDCLEWAKFYSIAWTHDNKGFYYTRYPAPESLRDNTDNDKRGAETDVARNQAIYYHIVGSSQERDRLVLSPTEQSSKHMFALKVTDDGRYLLISVSEDCAPRNLVWYVDVRAHFGCEEVNIIRFIDSFSARYTYIANDDANFHFLTNQNAPRNKIVRVDISDREQLHWIDVIPQHSKNVLSSAKAVNTWQLALVYMQDASERISLHNLKTGELVTDLPLPDLGEVQVWGKRKFSFLTFKFSSFLYPGTVYYCDLTLPIGDGLRVFRQMAPPGFDPSKYSTRQVFFSSKDETKVPMFIIGPKDEPENAKWKRPCLLYGYGGFCIPITPVFSTRFASWLQCLNGIVVIANIRGGDEVRCSLVRCLFLSRTYQQWIRIFVVLGSSEKFRIHYCLDCKAQQGCTLLRFQALVAFMLRMRVKFRRPSKRLFVLSVELSANRVYFHVYFAQFQ